LLFSNRVHACTTPPLSLDLLVRHPKWFMTSLPLR
jgi:hypothetical protein